ncbi:MAG: NAD(+) synthase [Clostridia bacterium]|nr:NAD(+) synthase [Clostridia bacterium]
MENTIRIVAAAPKIRLCDVEYNLDLFINEAARAEKNGAEIIVFPELALTGATAGDLYFSEVLTSAAENALLDYAEATKEYKILSFVGLPLRVGGAVYNAVAAISEGEIIGITAKSEHSRHFAPVISDMTVTLGDMSAIMRSNSVYSTEKHGTRVKIFVKIGDSNEPIPEGVSIIINPTATPEYVGIAAKRRRELLSLSSRLGVSAVLCGASEGESGTDGIYAAARLAAADRKILCEAPLFSGEQLVCDIPTCPAEAKAEPTATEEKIPKFPFIPEDKTELDLALTLQARALAGRMERAYIKTAVLGVSGGLDSTLALLVAAHAMDVLGKPRTDVIAITMPCFGTSSRTKSNALALAELLGCTLRTIDIKEAVSVHFKDIGHSENDYSVVYENAQARERTQILMDVSNATGGLVVGTGDLSELALGFATYGGDHLSMYGVNASVPKTLMRAMIARYAENARAAGNERLATVLFDVINTPVSPELLPTERGEENGQHTEKIVGPYELHDFFLYCTVKHRLSPAKILALASEAFGGEYTEAELRSYLGIFISRFFSQQFKRSCMPDGPRVTEISLSPRSAWQMPSDCSAALWKKSLQ